MDVCLTKLNYMKSLFILSFLTICVTHSSICQQVQGQAQSTKVNVSSKTIVERDLVLSDAVSNILTPLSVNLNNYTDILIVKANLRGSTCQGLTNPTWFYDNKMSFSYIDELLMMSSLNVQNPYLINKKNARKNNTFLRDVKNAEYLYLYISESKGKGDDVNLQVIVKNHKNKTVYKSSNTNLSLTDAIMFLTE